MDTQSLSITLLCLFTISSCATGNSTGGNIPGYFVSVDSAALNAFVTTVNGRFSNYADSSTPADEKTVMRSRCLSDPMLGLITAAGGTGSWVLLTYDMKDSCVLCSGTPKEGMYLLPIMTISIPRGHYVLRNNGGLSQFYRP